MERDVRPNAETLLRELGLHARLTVYLASAPGAGKTRRLLEEARALHRAGIAVSVGWIDTKGRPDLEALQLELPRIPPRRVQVEGSTFEDFDLAAALAAHPSVVVLDELAHTNLAGAANTKRWQDALALREAGISVIGALNVQHIETVAPVAERAIGFPIREIVPLSFLRGADQVVAVDAPPDLIEARLRAGALVAKDDIDRALANSFKPQTLQVLRELMLRTLDQLTIPVLRPGKMSTALAIFDGVGDPSIFLHKCAGFVEAFDFSLEVTSVRPLDDDFTRPANAVNARIGPPPSIEHGVPNWTKALAVLIAVPNGEMGRAVAAQPTDRNVLIIDPAHERLPERANDLSARHPYAQTAGDRLRIGYGKFTVYLGAAAGCGKTYAMLDRAHQMKAQGIDVVAALVETHGRPETAKMLKGLEVLARKDGELDHDALLRRRPQVALIDELAHTNPPGSAYPKRFDEVLSIVREGISVITTLNVQHLEGLGTAVLRMTGQRIRETLPDGILELADDVVLIDATPELLRERLRGGKIYPPERIDLALANFFTIDNLSALRELAIRETMHARAATRLATPFSDLVLGVKGRERDIDMIQRCARLASRVSAELTVVHVTPSAAAGQGEVVEHLAAAARAARAGWRLVVGNKPAEALVAFVSKLEAPALIVEGARGRRRFWHPQPFGRQLLDAGALDVFLISPTPYQTQPG